jgi:hypothetical protein
MERDMENNTELTIDLQKAKTVRERTVLFTVLGPDPLLDTPTKVYRRTLSVRTDTEETSHSTTVEEGVWYRESTGERLPDEVGVRLEIAYQKAD